MNSSLSGIDVAKRRQLAATLGLFAMLFLAVGAVAATGASTSLIRAFVVVALAVAVVLALMAWGVVHSVKADVAERRLDAAIAEAVAAQGARMCDCGNEHDPDEMHVVGEPAQHVTGSACAHDGTGLDCSHSCDTCVLAAARRPSPNPAPEAAFAQRRPSPAARRPSPRRT